MAIAIGTQAPNFTLRSKTAEGLVDVTLADHLGRDNVVLLFFPAAFTGVCTDEFCTMSGGLEDYKGLGAVVYGISCDTSFAQEAWANANNISVQLLSDYAHKATADYDVVLPDLAGHGPACKRAAFVIDKEGIVRYSEETATPGDLPNLEAVMAAVKKLN